MGVMIYRPDGDIDPRAFQLADAPASLEGVRVAVLDNGKPNADVVMTYAAEVLAAQQGAVVSLVTKKGPGGRSANAAIPCANDIFERLVKEADVVITGAADCGSCTAYSVHDAVELERAGIPTVVVTTTRFEPVVNALACSSGLPDIRKLVLEHPIGGTDPATLRSRVDAALPSLEGVWVRQPTGEVGWRTQELDELVSADGASFEVVAVDGDHAHLRLIIPDEKCAECVLPGPMLEQIATARLGRPVTIDDPRNGSNDAP